MATAPQLRRTLRLRDLILYGIIVIQPTAPMSVFGVLSTRGNGHVVVTILLAMIAMLFTAFSYGRMAQVYPSAGSAFTYVGQEVNAAAGFITGWSMVMDYMLNPIICIVWCSKAAMNFVPELPHAVWVVFFGLLFTGLNLQGIQTSARINAALAAGMGVVITIFFVMATRFVFHQPHDTGFFTRPFFDPAVFNAKAVLGGTSIAVLTYIGFDGISTLSEEAENPRRNILLATVLTCLVIGILSAFEVYAAQLIWPASQQFPDVDTAFVHVAGRAGGAWLFALINITLLVANMGSGLGAQLGAARLLYGMGRSSALPKSFFGKVSPRTHIPANNVMFVGLVSLIGAFTLSFSLGAEMLNFGALIAFMGVNLAALLHYYVRAKERKLLHLLMPAAGFSICLLLWLNLSRPAKLAGTLWMIAGIVFGAWKTRGFRGTLVNFDYQDSEKEEPNVAATLS